MSAPTENAYVLDEPVESELDLSKRLPASHLPGLSECQLLSDRETGKIVLRTRWVSKEAADSQLQVLRRVLGQKPDAASHAYRELQKATPTKKRTLVRSGLGHLFDWLPKAGSAIGVLAVAYIWFYGRLFAAPTVLIHPNDQSLKTVATERVAFRISLRNTDKDASVDLALSTQLDGTLTPGFSIEKDPRLETMVLNPSETRDITFYGRAMSGFGGAGSVTFTVVATGGWLRGRRTSSATVPLRIWRASEAQLVEAVATDRKCYLRYDLFFGVASPSGWSGQLFLKAPDATLLAVEPFPKSMDTARTLASFTVADAPPLSKHSLFVRLAPKDPARTLDCERIHHSIDISLDEVRK